MSACQFLNMHKHCCGLDNWQMTLEGPCSIQPNLVWIAARPPGGPRCTGSVGLMRRNKEQKPVTLVLSCAIIVTLVSMMICIHFVKVDHETLLIIRSLGVQVSSSFASGRECTSFIEMSKIKDIVINEAVHIHRVIYYLCILVKDPSDPEMVSSVVPLFFSSKPRLNCLVQVYKACQEVLLQNS
ncbi:phosphatidylinositol N-acetylglucosaminyltransferase subunit H-like [Alosa pseudoharengus]|uniref:phosphatidylinositol N-acetylglucosaminyltransferase subunit H-like n=1 Tax=Alosa pseudoharengus TaxID=34774 RepID=UPI003F8C8AC7